MVKTEVGAGRGGLSKVSWLSDVTDCVISLRTGQVQSEDSIMPCTYSNQVDISR